MIIQSEEQGSAQKQEKNMKAAFGPAGNPKPFYDAGGKHTYQVPAWLAEYGLDAYEYSAGKGVKGSLATFAKIGEEAKKYHIKMSFHAPYFISLSSLDESIRMRSIGYIKDSMAAAEALGADTIVIHSGSTSKMERSQALAIARDTILRAVDEIPDNGVHMGLETMGKVNQLGTLDEVIELCSAHKRLYPVVDFGHINARQFGGAFLCEDDYRRVFDRIGTALSEEKAKYLHCHFSKIEYTTPGGEKCHLTFADTAYGPEFEPLGEVIAKDGLAPRIICESAGTQAEDALFMKRCTYGK